MTVYELQAALKQLSETNVYHPDHLRQLLARLKELAATPIDNPPVRDDDDGA